MGRSVETPSNAVGVTYLHREFDEFDGQFEFDLLVEDIKETLKSHYPSLDDCRSWLSYPYRETSIILQNSQVNVCISEYCGLVAISVVVREDLHWDESEALAERNAGFIADKVEHYWGQLKKVGSFSNGEAVFEAAS